MDVSRIHPTQVRALLDGHAYGLFRDYHGNIKPLKLCLGLPRLLPGQLTPNEPEIYDDGGRNNSIYLGTCFPQKGFGFMEGVGLGLVGVGGERLEVDREVGRWMGEVVRRIPGVDGVDCLPMVGERGVRRFREEMPLLKRPKGEEYWDEEGGYVPKLPVAGVSSERLVRMKEAFRRSKGAKDADGGDGGVRWSGKVKREIEEWVVGQTAGEKVLGERVVLEWMREVVTRDIGFGEGRVEILETVMDEEIEETEVLFPLELGRRVGNEFREGLVEVKWPPEKECLKWMKSVEKIEGRDTAEGTLLGEFTGGYVIENLSENDPDGTPRATSLHIPSSPPTYHLITSGGPTLSPVPPSQSNKKRPRAYEDLYIEGPLTPLPSSPYPFHYTNSKSTKKPRPRLKIDLPPPAPTTSSQKLDSQEGKALPTPIITEGKFFVASLAQEQLSADDGLLREKVPIMDVYLEEMRPAAPWDGVDVLISMRDGESGIDARECWMGLAGRWWPGGKVIGLELGWKPFTRSTWGGEILSESIEGEGGEGNGGGLLEEVERGVDAGMKAEESLIPGDFQEGMGEEEEDEELEPILGIKETLGKRKRDYSATVQGNLNLSEQRQPQPQNPWPRKETEASSTSPQSVDLSPPLPLHRRRQLADILHEVTSSPSRKRPSLASKRLSPVRSTTISKPPSGFAPIFRSLTNSFSATSSLATFMTMRDRAAAVDPITVPSRLQSPTPLPQPIPAPAPTPRKMVVEVPKRRILAPVLPEILPKGQFVISTALLQSHRGVIRAVKALWGSNANWVEREYLSAEPHLHPPTPHRLGTGNVAVRAIQANEVPTEEEDYEPPPLLLSPTAGLFLTSLPLIRQRVLLPGEKEHSHPGASNRGVKPTILRMVTTVERLWVLVVAGEVTSGKDSEHWCAFLAFCKGVGAEGCRVIPILIPGGDRREEVVARWIGGVMYKEVMEWKDDIQRVAPWWAEEESEDDSQHHDVDEEEENTDADAWVTQVETTGERFLRRAGVNVFAAGAVLREVTRLENEDLQRGMGVMRRLLVMGSEGRMALLGQLVGERAVERLSKCVEGV